MDSQEATSFDRDFDEILVDMKPYVLHLPHKTERQRCALWIKKFCDPQSSGLSGRRIRNQYAQLLLHMLKRGSLEGPFTARPDVGPLPPLPAYMSIYFDDATPGGMHDTKEARVPDWVSCQLMMDLTGVSSIASEPMPSPGVSQFDVRDRYGCVMTGLSPSQARTMAVPARVGSTSPINTYSLMNHHKPVPFCLDPLPKPPPPLFPISHVNDTTDEDFTRHGNHAPMKSDSELDWHNPMTSLTLGTTSGSLFRDEPFVPKSQERELEMRVKMIQAKSQEDKLKLQQRHDANVQKILDRKNSEIEEFKSHYRTKAKENEEVIAKLERKVSQLQKEWTSVRDSKDTQLGELKRLSEDTVRSQQEEADQRVSQLTAAFEHEKFELQKSNTRAIQELLEETSSRLQKMECECQHQRDTTSVVIRELEGRVQQLSCEAQTLNDERNVLARDKMEAEGRIERLETDLEGFQNRSVELDIEIRSIKTDTDQEIRSLKNKHDAHLTFIKDEYSLASVKSADTVADLQAKVTQLKVLLEETEAERHRQIRELEHLQLQDKQHLEHLHEKKVKNLQHELEQANQDAQMKIRKLEQVIRERDDEVNRLSSSQRDQAKLSEQSLTNFKRQVELNSSRMYDDMKKQMEKVECDLNRSKQLREKQAKELQRQLEEQRLKYEQKGAEQKECAERELTQALHDTHAQKAHELETARETFRNDLADIEQRYCDKRNQDAKTIQRLEEEVQSLRDELLHSNQLRKQQLLELGQLREDEQHRMQHEHDQQMSGMRSYVEEQKLEMEKSHAAEVEDVLEKTNGRLREIDNEYQMRNNQATETTSELQQTIDQLKAELQRQVVQANSKLVDISKKCDEEKKKLKQHLTNSTLTLQEALEKEHGHLRQSERALTQQQQWYEEQLVSIRGQYEDKIRGLIPASIRQELEDTISSLKSQVNSLQQHAAILQEELDLVHDTGYGGSHLVAGSSTTNTLIGSALSLKTS